MRPWTCFLVACVAACSTPRREVAGPEPTASGLRAVPADSGREPASAPGIAARLDRIRTALQSRDNAALDPERKTRVEVLRGLVEEALAALREERVEAAASLTDKAATICADLFPDTGGR